MFPHVLLNPTSFVEHVLFVKRVIALKVVCLCLQCVTVCYSVLQLNSICFVEHVLFVCVVC